MELYLISTNPQNTSLLSANGVVHYLVETSRSSSGTRLTSILRPAASPEDSVIAEIEWRNSNSATVIRSPMLVVANDPDKTNPKSGEGLGAGIKLMRYMYRRNRFSSVRYFIADDKAEYRWKIIKGRGCILSSTGGAQIASSNYTLVTEGVFAGEKKQNLLIQPSSVDIDLIILTFIIMECRRRERDGYGLQQPVRDEEPHGDGGESGEAAVEGDVIGEL
ncbi:hypothetical protein D9619_006052 [Psilocybe cf. subviscida]|uniref:DUF6593 domain-containing protein n=1 Tax=Psilocybe cf. subviscida TaxID=2480587 RepID=A0A8H5FBW3_9AGAR|nr:hypothetical protein D9619_006052 [Psilocybe cf. subviscida]